MAECDDTTLARFWAKVRKDGPTPEHMPHLGQCWVWTAGRRQAGYGRFKTAGRYNQAHRFSWTLANGPIPRGLFILHHCDNPPCVRPDHLFIGTQTDNMADMNAKNRLVNVVGERHGNSKVTVADVVEIRRRVADGEPQSKVAGDYDIAEITVWTIVRRTRWKHVP